MSNLETRKTRLTFSTGSTVREKGKYRAVVIEARPYTAVIRLQGTRTTFPVSWEAIYHLAARQAAELVRKEKQAAKKSAPKKPSR